MSLQEVDIERAFGGKTSSEKSPADSGHGSKKSRSKKSSSKDGEDKKNSAEKKSSRKDLKKGLSPPKADDAFDVAKINQAAKAVKLSSVRKPLLPADEFDTTQWEHSKWRDSHARWLKGEQSKSLPVQPVAVSAGPVLGEDRQSVQARGAHLKRTPWLSIGLLGLETALVVCWLGVSVGERCSEVHSYVATSLSGAMMLISLCILFLVMTTRCHVRCLVLGDQLYYAIRYKWKIVLFALQWGRVCVGLAVLLTHVLQWNAPLRLGLVVGLVSVQLIVAIVVTVYTLRSRFTLVKPHDE